MRTRISQSIRDKIPKMYRTGRYTHQEIANLLDVSLAFVDLCLKGKVDAESVKNKRCGGYWKKVSKYSADEEAQIAEDYYKNGLSLSALKEKYGIHPVQLQRIRNKFVAIYGEKKRGIYANERFEELEGEKNGK